MAIYGSRVRSARDVQEKNKKGGHCVKATTSINGNVVSVNLPEGARNWTKLDSPSETENSNNSVRQDSVHKALTPRIIKKKVVK